MKTLTFILCLLFLVSCGKNNTSGSRPQTILPPDPIHSDSEIVRATQTRNGVMVEGTTTNFAIPVFNITNIFKSRNLIGVIYLEGGLRVRIYNASGKMLLGSNVNMTNPRLNVRDDIAGLEYQDRTGRSRYISVNTMRTLLDITADDIRGTVDFGVVAVAYRRAGIERAVAMKATGETLFADRPYVRPRFTIDPYVLTLNHSRGIEQIQH